MQYKLLNPLQAKDEYRASFNQLTKEMFGFTFEDWYQAGYWSTRNEPWSLYDTKVIANVSVNKVKLKYQNQEHFFIQLGTVMTAKDYRKQGLSRYLIEGIISEWSDQAEGIFLLANKTVTEFYPLFGFKKIEQYSYSNRLVGDKIEAQKLDINNLEDLNLFSTIYNQGNNYSLIDEVDNFNLVMFYCLDYLKDCVFYLKKYACIVIARQENKALHVYAIYGKTTENLTNVIGGILPPTTTTVVLEFTPKNPQGWKKEKTSNGDTLFYYEKKKSPLFNVEGLFPKISHT